MSSHNSRGEEFGVQTNVEPQHCTGWRDIASAPRDGTTFLLLREDGDMIVARRHNPSSRTDELYSVPGMWLQTGRAWMPLPSSEEQSIGSSERQRAEGNPATDEPNTFYHLHSSNLELTAEKEGEGDE